MGGDGVVMLELESIGVMLPPGCKRRGFAEAAVP